MQTFIYKEKVKWSVKETVWQSVVIRAEDEGESLDQCGEGIVQKFQSKDRELELESEYSKELQKSWRRFLCYRTITKVN